VLAKVRAHEPDAGATAAAVRATATITRAARRYRLALRIEDRDAVAERTIEGDDCAALADAAALLIALALTHADDDSRAADDASPGARTTTRDERERAAHARAAGEPDAGAAPGTAGQPRPTGTPARAEPRAQRIIVSPDNEVRDRPAEPLAFRFALGAALALDAGMLPHAPALGVEPLLQLQLDRLRAQLALGLWLARAGPSERYAAAQLNGSGALGKLSLGADLLHAPLAFGPRAVLELGRLAIATRGISVPQRGVATWAAAGAALHLGYPLMRRLEMAFELGVLFPFARPRWLLRVPTGEVDLFTAAPAVLRVTTGVAYSFP
jgi:hypothetical protein